MNGEKEWKARLAWVAQRLGFTIVGDCAELNAKHLPRYYHANVVERRAPLTTWRLKVSNPQRRPDVEGCNRNNNCVHDRLAQIPIMGRFARIPKFFDIPEMYWSEVSVSELIESPSPTVNHLAAIVEYLLNLQLHRRDIIQALCDPSLSRRQALFGYNQRDYKQRLKHSLQGLSDSISVSNDEAISKFEARFREPLGDDKLTFAHGDFSFGNLKVEENRLVLLDFEHSHIGIGCIDLAHLYVNLTADGNRDAARALRNSYRKRAEQENVWFDRDVFDALILERAAGKMNAMEAKAGEHFERLEDLMRSIILT